MLGARRCAAFDKNQDYKMWEEKTVPAMKVGRVVLSIH